MYLYAFIQISSTSLLPATIDPSIASTVFQRQHHELLNRIFWCFPSINDALYAECLIPQDVYETVRDQVAHHQDTSKRKAHRIGQPVGKHDRAAANSLVDCMAARVRTDFVKIVRVLESYPDHLLPAAKKLVQDYCKYMLAAGCISKCTTIEDKYVYCAFKCCLSFIAINVKGRHFNCDFERVTFLSK